MFRANSSIVVYIGSGLVAIASSSLVIVTAEYFEGTPM
jgi:hypothetical protein